MASNCAANATRKSVLVWGGYFFNDGAPCLFMLKQNLPAKLNEIEIVLLAVAASCLFGVGVMLTSRDLSWRRPANKPHAGDAESGAFH